MPYRTEPGQSGRRGRTGAVRYGTVRYGYFWQCKRLYGLRMRIRYYCDLRTLQCGANQGKIELDKIQARMAQWSDAETAKLIDIWNEDKIQEELEGCKKNKHIFDKISSRMRSACFDRSTEQCRLKVKKLRVEYKKIRDGNKKTGEDRKDWKHFDALDAILGSKPSTEPLIVVDTLAGHCGDVQPFTVEDEGEDGEESDEVIVGETEMLGTSQSSISTANLDCVEDEKVDVKERKKYWEEQGKEKNEQG